MRIWSRRACVLAAFLLAGCKVITLGDSNTVGKKSWPGILQRRLDEATAMWTVENRAKFGMRAGRTLNADGSDETNNLEGERTWARFHLERLLAEDDLAGYCRRRWLSAFAPRLVIALGTNDAIQRRPPGAIVDDILALKAHAEEVAPCLRVYVALIPPMFFNRMTPVREIDVTNAVLRDRLPRDRVIDFYTGFTQHDFADQVHFTLAGQAKRAEIAYRALFPTLGGF